MPTPPTKVESGSSEGRAGLPIDIYGGQTVDPTKNVLDLVTQQVKRIDDIADLREQHRKELATKDREIREKETSRLDSIRQVDVQNQALAAKGALDAIQTLANTTTTTAAALAKQVTELASSIAASTAASFGELSKRIAALELASAEGAGKTKVVDPQIEALINEVKGLAASRNVQTGSDPALAETLQTILKTQSATATEIAGLRESRSQTTGSGMGQAALIGWIFGGIGALVSVILLILRFSGR